MSDTYSKLKKDPTTKFRTKLINILKQWKQDKSISNRLYWRLYLNAEVIWRDKIRNWNSPETDYAVRSAGCCVFHLDRNDNF